MINRREMLQRALIAAGVPRSCCSTPTAPAESTTFEDGCLVIDLAKAADLGRQGSALKVVDPSHGVDIIIAHVSEKRFAAWDRSCTHGGVQVTYNPTYQTVMCTSWGHSEFDLEGRVLRGSARKPLRTYPAELIGDRLRINLEARS